MKRLAAFIALSSCVASPVFSQETNCGPTAIFYDQLTERYTEARQMWAMVESGQVVEIWAGPNGWTLIVTDPEGTSCMVAEGQDWGMSIPDTEPNL